MKAHVSITGRRGAGLGSADGRLVVSSTAGGKITLNIHSDPGWSQTTGTLYLDPADVPELVRELTSAADVLAGWARAGRVST